MSQLINNQESNKVSFSAPSNIAFVKYWGKHGRQLPMNPSISMTLSKCVTNLSMEYKLNSSEKGVQSFLFEGEENEKFKARIEKVLNSIEDVYPLASKLSLKIESENTFPHSAGIASSASAMAAFAACLTQIEINEGVKVEDFNQRASFLARLASGSACRSFYPNYAVWGETKMEMGSDDFAIGFEDFHEEFQELNDTVLLVSSKEKSVSSSAGHSLMNGHFYKATRKEHAHENMRSIVNAMKNGDWEHFGEILENEALCLHALMMTSSPSFVLLEPNSLAIIDSVRKFREETKLPLYFTIDAGPNIHLIYPNRISHKVLEFIENDLSAFCENKKFIHDFQGKGIKRL